MPEQPEIKLSPPQETLLLKLHARPAAVSRIYRPLLALIEKDLVRVSHPGAFGSNPTYDCSPTGAVLAAQIKEKRAATGRECTCGKEWSLKHDPDCLSRSTEVK